MLLPGQPLKFHPLAVVTPSGQQPYTVLVQPVQTDTHAHGQAHISGEITTTSPKQSNTGKAGEYT